MEEGADRGPVRPARATPTPTACWRRFRRRPRPCSPPGWTGPWAASCRRPRPRRAAASSAPDAPTPSDICREQVPALGGRTARAASPATAGGRSKASCEAPFGAAPGSGFVYPRRTMTCRNRAHLRPSDSLRNVRYEIRGKLAHRAHGMRAAGLRDHLAEHRQPGRLRLPHARNHAPGDDREPAEAEGYCHQKGIFPAREAVVMQQQARGITGVTAEEVFIGNGVSELIDLVLRALLNPGDEVLVPSPDYPLWTAAVTLNGGKRRALSLPPRERLRAGSGGGGEASSRSNTRAIVVINPNNPTGAVYPRSVLEALARLAERHGPRRVRGRNLRPDDCTTARVRADGDAGARTRCAPRCPGFRRSIAPAAIAWAGSRSPAARATRRNTSQRSSC